MEMMLQTQNLCKYFRKQKAVNNVSLNIEKGQIYGLLGPNGAGKSTTLKMLTGMMKPTAGKIYFDGKLLDRKDLSKIGALIENPPIYENLSARENLKVRQLLLGTDENRIDEVLQIVSLTNTGNYAEQKINEAYDTILRADKVTAEMIPALCDYVIFSENGEKIGGDLSEQYEQIAWNVAKHGNASGKYFYKVIVRENEYVVLQYRLTPQYHSAFLREHFIGPQNVMIIMSVIGAVAIIIIQSIRFGKRIKKQMQPVLDAIGQIKDQSLEYETSCSGIKEFDDCLSAIDDMRDALRESLEKQWKTEQEKKQQMSALAHDIKTPLTIVRGNAELLSETELTTEQKNNITYVLNGTTQIQSYVKQLIDVTKSWNCSDVTYTTVRLEDFFADIKEQALGLVEIYHQKIDWKAEQSDKKVTIAYDPMFRAVMNMIQNAVEHTKENGIIYIDAKEQDGRLTFIVEDSGSGFTKEALLHGTEQFFMDDTSRNGEAHYGMGLFFAKTVAEKYGGGIKLSNSENTGGARVEIFFLSSQETS